MIGGYATSHQSQFPKMVRRLTLLLAFAAFSGHAYQRAGVVMR